MKRATPLTFLLASLFVAVPLYAASKKDVHPSGGKPAVYVYVGKSERIGYAEVKARYGKKFRIVDLKDERGYTRSKVTIKVTPNSVYESGQIVRGSVRLMFIVTEKGRVLEPFVLSSTDARLNDTVLTFIMRWRGTPARLNNIPISVVLAQDFTFAKRGQ